MNTDTKSIIRELCLVPQGGARKIRNREWAGASISRRKGPPPHCRCSKERINNRCIMVLYVVQTFSYLYSRGLNYLIRLEDRELLVDGIAHIYFTIHHRWPKKKNANLNRGSSWCGDGEKSLFQSSELVRISKKFKFFVPIEKPFLFFAAKITEKITVLVFVRWTWKISRMEKAGIYCFHKTLHQRQNRFDLLEQKAAPQCHDRKLLQLFPIPSTKFVPPLRELRFSKRTTIKRQEWFRSKINPEAESTCITPLEPSEPASITLPKERRSSFAGTWASISWVRSSVIQESTQTPAITAKTFASPGNAFKKMVGRSSRSIPPEDGGM